MAWIELTNKRSQKSKHFYDSDTNRFRAVLTIHDQHYKDELDQWQNVDENFEDDTGNFNKKCDKTRHAIHIANGGNRRWYPRRNVLTEYVDITGMEYWTGSQWRNLNLPTPVWTNNKSEWDMTNLYASLTNTWRRLKADFILKNNTAPTGLRYAISFVGLTYNVTTGELTSTTDGLVWGYINPPTAKDANGTNISVSQTYDGIYIEWSVDTTGAIFPIYVDPTFTDGYGGDIQTYCDTYLESESWGWDGNNGTADYLYNTWATDSRNQRILIKFNVSSIPESATISSSTLYIYNQGTSNPNGYTYYLHAILSANSAWTELGATWNHAVHNTVDWAGDTGGDGGYDAGCSVSGTDYNATSFGDFTCPGNSVDGYELTASLDTDVIHNWITANYGFIIRSAHLQYINSNYYSSDHATTGYRPRLVVEYTANVNSSKSAYLKGQTSTSDIKHAYLCGGIDTQAIHGTFTDGVDGDIQTYVDTGVDNGAPTYNYGTGNIVNIGYPSSIGRMLLRFDISSLAGKTINSATLYLTPNSVDEPGTLDAYNIASGNSGWIEGTQFGGVAATGEPCWSYKEYNTVTWAGSAGLSTATTDYNPNKLFDSIGNWEGGVTKAIPLSVARVTDWLTGNYGLIIRSQNETSWNNIQMATSDYTPISYRPKLVIQYTYVAEGSSKHAYLEGATAGTETSDNKHAFLQGTYGFEIEWIVVATSSVSETLISDNQSAYLKGQDIASNTKSAYLRGQTSIIDSQIAYIQGQASVLSNKNAYLAGTATASDSKHAYLNGWNILFDSKHAYTSGLYTGISNLHAYIHGQQEGITNLAGYIHGQAEVLDNISAFTRGQDFLISNKSVYICGQSLFSGNKNAFVSGGIIVSDTKSAYLHGSSQVNDTKSAFIAGGISTSDNKGAYIKGQVDVLDNTPAFTQGFVEGIPVSDHKDAYLSGISTTSSNKQAWLVGGIETSALTYAYISGWNSLVSNKFVYTSGSSVLNSNKNAYTKGRTTSSDNKHAYLRGQMEARSGFFWLAGGVNPANVVAAYEPKGSSNYADSLLNKANPGTNDAFDDGHAPGWNITDGWMGVLSESYLCSTIIPAANQTWSALVKFTNFTMMDWIFGSANGTWMTRFGVMITAELAYWNGGAYSNYNTVSSGVLGWAGNKAYKNGVQETGTISPGDGSLGVAISPLGFNANGTYQARSTVRVQAEVWYNTVLTPFQMAAVTAAMNNPGNCHAYTKGQVSTNDSKHAYLCGSVQTNDTKSAYTSGGIVSNDSTIAFTTGQIETINSVHAFVNGYAPGVVSLPAYTRGLDSGAFSTSAFVQGAYGFEIEWVVVGVPAGQVLETSSNISAFIQGSSSTQDSQSAFTTGSITVSESIPAFTNGIDTAQTNKQAFVSGLLTSLDFITAFTSGITANDTSIHAYTSGRDVSSSSIDAYIAGKLESESNVPAFTTGIAEVRDSKSAYINGYSANASSVKAFTKGQNYGIISQHSYIAGQISITDFTPAYIHGEEETSTIIPAFTSGKVITSSSVHVFISGYSGNASSIPAFTYGQVTTTSNINAYTIGTLRTSKNAYIAGKIPTISNKSAYIAGKSEENSINHAFIEGGIIESSNQTAFTSGFAITVSSKNAFISGTVANISFVHAYMYGAEAIRSLVNAYTSGTVPTEEHKIEFAVTINTNITFDVNINKGLVFETKINPYMDFDVKIEPENKYLVLINKVIKGKVKL